MTRFEVDPTLVADALAQGRKLVVEVYSERHYRVTLGEMSPHRQPVAIGKRA
jgi:hypothetical protein